MGKCYMLMKSCNIDIDTHIYNILKYQGSLEDIDLGNSWTIFLQMQMQVQIHLSYHSITKCHRFPNAA